MDQSESEHNKVNRTNYKKLMVWRKIKIDEGDYW